MAEKIWYVALDAGHGLKTAGKQTPTGIKEWTLNDSVCDKVMMFLEGYNVRFLRTDNNEGNTDESLSSRKSRYINAGVDCFISVHHNAFTGSWNSATGVEVYYDRTPSAEDKRLANCVYKRLVSYTGMKGRGVKAENWSVINHNYAIASILCEGGFMDGSSDYKYIISEDGQLAYARAVADGLIEFLGLKKTSSTEQPKAPASTSTTTANVPYMVRVDKVDKGDVLNVRKEPKSNATITGALAYNDKNTYTIVEEKNGWGNLKSGVGWIYLYYTKKVAETKKPSENFVVKIVCDELNIRQGAGLDYKVVGVVKKNYKYTITEVQGSWGKLLSGAGWINISTKYVKRV